MEEERTLDALIQKRLRRFAPNRPIRISVAELPTVRESEQLRTSSGYEIELREHDTADVLIDYTDVIDAAEVIDRFPSVTRLTIDRRFVNVRGLALARRLKLLNVSAVPFDERLTLSTIRGLELLGISGGIERVDLAHATLRDVAIHDTDADAAFFSAIGSLPKLERLQLHKLRFTNLRFFSELKMLKKLAICRFTRLTSVDGLDRLGSNLEELELLGCRNIDDLSCLSLVKSLRVIRLTSLGEIDSLEPIADLPKLEAFIVEGTSFKDGRTSVMDRAPSLDSLYFQNKRHYDKKLKEFEQAI